MMSSHSMGASGSTLKKAPPKVTISTCPTRMMAVIGVVVPRPEGLGVEHVPELQHHESREEEAQLVGVDTLKAVRDISQIQFEQAMQIAVVEQIEEDYQ